MKYYLLTFNDDYGDEHNVPALACMNGDEYLQWYNSKVGERNENYEDELKAYQLKKDIYDAWWEEYCVAQRRGADVPELFTISSRRPTYVGYDNIPKKGESYLYAWLGNNGEYFGEAYNAFTYAHELVEANIVRVSEVTEEFHTLFHKNKLADLSLCNVFCIEY